jgi:hypothetical protein
VTPRDGVVSRHAQEGWLANPQLRALAHVGRFQEVWRPLRITAIPTVFAGVYVDSDRIAAPYLAEST